MTKVYALMLLRHENCVAGSRPGLPVAVKLPSRHFDFTVTSISLAASRQCQCQCLAARGLGLHPRCMSTGAACAGPCVPGLINVFWDHPHKSGSTSAAWMKHAHTLYIGYLGYAFRTWPRFACPLTRSQTPSLAALYIVSGYYVSWKSPWPPPSDRGIHQSLFPVIPVPAPV